MLLNSELNNFGSFNFIFLTLLVIDISGELLFISTPKFVPEESF